MIANQYKAAIAALALAGCAQTTAQHAAAIPTLPANYRQLIIEHVRQTYNDPYSIRDAAISAPIAGTSFFGAVQSVCVRANAKNRMGGYIGLKANAITFREGRIVSFSEEYAGMICDGAIYEPFPEIDAGAQPRSR
jgi:hypothetical protein